MIVYVAESGIYEDRGIQGVYADLETAMADLGGGEWKRHGEGHWSNGKDGSHHMSIEAYQLIPKGGSWETIDE